jgi:hypothetical protein
MLKQLLLLGFFVFLSGEICAQVEASDSHDNLQATINQTLRIPLRIKNTSDKAQFYVIRKTKGEMGDTQKGYFFQNDWNRVRLCLTCIIHSKAVFR